MRAYVPPMCNLYSHTKGQQAIVEATRAMIDRTGAVATAMVPLMRKVALPKGLVTDAH